MRTTFLLLAVIGLSTVFTARCASCDDGTSDKDSGAFSARGYLSACYSYVGSSSAATVYSGLRVSGSLTLSAFSDKLTLRYQSRHWMHFERPKNSVLASPFENRNILQTVSIECRDLPVRGLRCRAGRFFPDMDYAACPVIDGGGVTMERKGFTICAAAGRIVDLWSGNRESSDMLVAYQLRYRTGRCRLSAGYQSASAFGIDRKEVPAGFNIRLHGDVWLESYAGYEFESKGLSRTGFSLTLRRNSGSLSITASRWRNPFDQLVLAAKSRSAASLSVHSPDGPSTYDDIRVSGSFRRGGWGIRGTFASMAGVRSGWMTSAYVIMPTFFGFRANLGSQAMRSDHIEFYSLDGLLTVQAGDISLQLQSQTRNYQWLPQPSGARVTDNYSEISAEYPLRKHLFMSAAAGGFIRKLGDEGFKPQFELRLIARL